MFKIFAYALLLSQSAFAQQQQTPSAIKAIANDHDRADMLALSHFSVCEQKILELDVSKIKNLSKSVGSDCAMTDTPCTMSFLMGKVQKEFNLPSPLLEATAYAQTGWANINDGHHRGPFNLIDVPADMQKAQQKYEKTFVNDVLVNTRVAAERLRDSLVQAEAYSKSRNLGWTDEVLYQHALEYYFCGEAGFRANSQDPNLKGCKTQPEAIMAAFREQSWKSVLGYYLNSCGKKTFAMQFKLESGSYRAPAVVSEKEDESTHIKQIGSPAPKASTSSSTGKSQTKVK